MKINELMCVLNFKDEMLSVWVLNYYGDADILCLI